MEATWEGNASIVIDCACLSCYPAHSLGFPWPMALGGGRCPTTTKDREMDAWSVSLVLFNEVQDNRGKRADDADCSQKI